MKACPRCRKGQIVRFDPRDREAMCLACGHVIYHDEPMPYIEGREAQPPSYEASVSVEERLRRANAKYKRKKRGHPLSRRGVEL